MISSTGTEPPDGNGLEPERALRRPARLALGTGLGLLGEAILGYHHPVIEVISVAFDVGLPGLLTLLLVGTVLFGSKARQERAFRLLRWIADKPEPPKTRTQ